MSQPNVRRLGVTGATGYLGSVISAACTATGVGVVAMTRRRHSDASTEWRYYDIDKPLGPGLLDGLDGVVHCAYDMTARTPSDIWRINVEGTRRLMSAMSDESVRGLVMSSMSAYDGTGQLYGRAKLAIEAEAHRSGFSVLRPGLVYGPHAGGMMGTLSKLARLPVVPVVTGGAYQYLLHEDDLSAAVLAVLGSKGAGSEAPLGVAHPERVPFRRIMEGLVARSGRSGPFVPVSGRFLRLALAGAERARLSPPVRADSVLGLIRPAPFVPNLDALERLGVRPRPFVAESAP